MAIRTTSLIPFKINDIPDRFTMLYVSDPTVSTTSTSGISATQRINRVQSASFSSATGVIDVVELGSIYRPGGVTNLGEISWNLSFNAVGIHNIAALTGQVIPTTKGTTLTISSTTMNLATIDFIRMVADNAGNVIGTLYMQDCIINDYGITVNEGGLITETSSGKGPNSLFFPGFIIPKVYQVVSGDVTNGYITMSGLFSTSEQPVEIYRSPYGQPPSYWMQNGTVYFLKIERVPGTSGAPNLANTPYRYHEVIYNSTLSAIAATTTWVTPAYFDIPLTIVGNSVTIGNPNSETVPILAVAPQVNTTSNTAITSGTTVTITPASMLGIEVGVTVTVDPTGANPEVVQVTAVTSSTFTVAAYAHNHTGPYGVVNFAPSFQATFGHTHLANVNLYPPLNPSQNYNGVAYYNTSNSRLNIGDTFAVGDVFRFVFCSYNTDTSLPLTIPNNADPTDRPGVPSRMIPLTINALNAKRVQRASYKMTLKRDHVQGIGENSIAYGVSSVPDVAIDLDAKETDLSLLAQINIGTQNLTSQGGPLEADFEDLDFITRNTLANAVPTAVNLFDPFNAGSVLCTWASPQFIPTSIGYSSSNKSDNTVRITGMDITGNMTVSYTAPY